MVAFTLQKNSPFGGWKVENRSTPRSAKFDVTTSKISESRRNSGIILSTR